LALKLKQQKQQKQQKGKRKSRRLTKRKRQKRKEIMSYRKAKEEKRRLRALYIYAAQPYVLGKSIEVISKNSILTSMIFGGPSWSF
jgi:hypothetical protein